MQASQHIRARTEQACTQYEYQGPPKVSIKALSESRQNQRRDDSTKPFHVSPSHI